MEMNSTITSAKNSYSSNCFDFNSEVIKNINNYLLLTENGIFTDCFKTSKILALFRKGNKDY